ncbi:hypothetical protein VPNG_07688 [Cytospora leucostoma]|uniref:Uncharacterized protein n=1 Tax=Cytospora leucostoma TaxID=1230097 RepID=A0A423WFL0_9PEZI|nr:hypothetical protein VPNG_07688 [Cytospora leucostoma]
MPARKSVAAAAAIDSSDEDEINVNKVVETKTELDKIRKERDNKRAQLQAGLDKKLDDLRARTRQSVAAHIQELSVHDPLGLIDLPRRVDHLLQAIEARDNILRAISEKLAEAQDAGDALASYLDSACEHRVKRAESFAAVSAAAGGKQSAGGNQMGGGRHQDNKKARVEGV